MNDFLHRISHFSAKRLALLADELQRRVTQLEAAQHAPIAIVGMACRFPGGADTPARFWELLSRGDDAITEVPRERWNIDDYYDANPDAPGKMSTRWGGFLRGVDGFDAHFFGISPREAQRMDPQQRLLLEVAWEALEHAGVNADRLAETRTGVFVGMSSVDYLQLMRGAGLGSFDAYTASGAAHSIASGRISYLLGARGPSMSIDTACSSSLVAIHQAVGSLRRKESDLALAGGVNLILRPDVSVALSKAHMMAPDGRCKVFDARADGFVRSEGCGVLVLKRLADAQADGDTVLAVIRGSASNQDGRSNGLTAPNGAAQEAVVRAALDDARLTPADVQVVETHGTGTSLGDPIEVQALAAVYGAGRSREDALLIGSVKANIGHLEAAAGVAAVIKLALVLEHGQMPPQQHFVKPNPFIPWDELAVRVPTHHTAFSAPPDGARLGGVSSFGFSGTNVHLVLASAPPRRAAPESLERPRHVLTLSARSEGARRALLESYQRALDERSPHTLADVAFTANTGRAALTQRVAVVASTRAEARARLGELLAGHAPNGVATGEVPPRPPRVAFLFTGQGAQYAGMARSLYETQPCFRQAIDACEALLRERSDRPLSALIFEPPSGPSAIDRTEYTQPALFAVEYALAALWQSWGIEPCAVLGHSLGEYVAACVAGILSLEQALSLVVERGRLMGALPDGGAMAALMADEAYARALVASAPHEVSIAAVNGPEHVVLSGRAERIDALIAQAAAQGVRATKLTVSHAFHSPLVEPMIAEFGRLAESLTPQPARCELVSNVTGACLAGRALDAAYWREHVRAPVQFARGMETLAALGCDTFLEIGPQPTLLGMARHVLTEERLAWLPSLRRGVDDWTQLLESLSALYVRGASVDFRGFDAGYARRKVVLPSYPFQRQRYWVDVAPESPEPAQRAQPPAQASALDTMLHDITWRDVPAPGERLLTPADLRALISPRIDAVAAESGVEAYAPFVPALDHLATSYILQALRDLGAELPAGAAFEATSLADRLAVLPRHRRLFDRMLAILVEDGLLTRDAGMHRVTAALGPREADLEAQRLHEQHPAGAAELHITSRCGRELARVLTGALDPLPLLFPGGSLADMEALYQSSPPAVTYNRLIAEAVRALERAWSREQPLRILEIGGGTGSTTAYVLPELPDQGVEYTFTDLSPLFLSRAKEKFGDRACVRYGLLDISTDPSAQGFAAGSFDLIIGANVAHATPDIATTLQHARGLLSPGGQLILLEGSTPQRFGDLTVGLLEGWWAFTDLTRRSYALMSREAWLSALREAGFARLAVLVDADAGPVLEQQAILLAQPPDAEPRPSATHFILVPDAGDAGGELAQLLRARGHGVHTLSAADAATLQAELTRALRDAPADTAVVHLAALQAALDEETSAEALWAREERLVRSALATLHAAASAPRTPALWFVTRGAQPTHAGDLTDPAQAALWGLSHTVALEHPELRCRRVDLDAARPSSEGLARLAAELRAPGSEDQLALRAQRRLARRLVRRAPEATAHASGASTPIHPDATYLVTGGLRGLGWRVAEWLVDRGARSLVLMGRRPPDAAITAQLQALGARSARIVCVSGDVSRAEDVQRVLQQIARELPPLRGIIHSAGALADGVLAGQTWERFAGVMAPKVLGTWHLHRLAGPLDFFVIFSSGAAVAGSPGQANHAAANAFEDALAWYRQAQGQPTVSINWGPWAEIGAAVDRKVSGPPFVRFIAPRDGLRALEIALERDATGARLARAQVVAIASDWAELANAPAMWRDATLFRELAPRRRAPSAASPERAAASGELGLRERLSAIAPNRRRAALQDHVRGLTLKVLGVPPSDAFDVHEPLRQLGLDSLMAVELRNALAKEAGRPMPATITFDHPSVSALTSYLAAELLDAEPTQDTAPAPLPAEPLRAAESDAPHDADLSDDELAARLARRLDHLFSEDPQ